MGDDDALTSSNTAPITLKSEIHPATTVTNIKTHIPFTLEIESSQYSSWATLFTLHCRAHLVEDHLKAKPETTTPESSSALATWNRLDAIVLQWLYSTISNDLLHTIIDKTSTAHDAWVAIENLFHDNKASRAIYLMQKFANTRLDGFPNISAYCQALKTLSDQLANVDAAVTDERLVLQLIAGLNDQYEGIGTIITQQRPLPSFYNARSQLIQVETRKNEQALLSSKTASTALTAQATRPATDYTRSPSDSYRGRGRSGRRGRGRGSYGRGRSNHPTYYPPQPYYPWAPYWPTPPPQYPYGPTQQPNTWSAPPCPYPSTNRPNSTTSPQSQAGLLGPRPHQAHTAYSPTDIEQALYTMSLQQPDPTQYMDTGTTGNMSHEQRDFHTFFLILAFLKIYLTSRPRHRFFGATAAVISTPWCSGLLPLNLPLLPPSHLNYGTTVLATQDGLL
ncbi:putative RNA-directed DNA polymerase [Helianthus annuus]|nr:putative RNA-directed DNA polymerase [Helianthus annuus]